MMETKPEVIEFECSKGRLKKSYGLQGLSRLIRERGSTILLKMLAMVLRIGGPTPEYDQIDDGGKISVDWEQQGLNLACCDCGLVHYVTFEVIENIVVLTMMRNEEETDKCREIKNIKFEAHYDE